MAELPASARDLERLAIWRGLDAWRAESVAIRLDDEGVEATGTQIGLDPLPYRLDYRLEAPAGFVTRRMAVEARGSGWRRRLDLRHDGAGSWTVDAGADGEAVDLPQPGGEAGAFEGALDCDLGLSPLTNLMPIRRSRLLERPGAEDFLMAWIAVPQLTVVASAQRYEHVSHDEEGAIVRYLDRGLFPGFEAELRLDRSGVALLYPELAERINPPEGAHAPKRSP